MYCRSSVSLGESRQLLQFKQIGLGNKPKLIFSYIEILRHFSLKILILDL